MLSSHKLGEIRDGTNSAWERHYDGGQSVEQYKIGATWQRCRVHAMRNALAYVPKGQHTMVAAATR